MQGSKAEQDNFLKLKQFLRCLEPAAVAPCFCWQDTTQARPAAVQLPREILPLVGKEGWGGGGQGRSLSWRTSSIAQSKMAVVEQGCHKYAWPDTES